MKIDFAKNQEGYQQAQKFRLILTDYYNNNPAPETRSLIDDLIHQIDNFLSGLEENDTAPSSSILDYLSSFWNFLVGPSQRELELSKQRKALIERAEHAESSAFEALAETSEIKQEYEKVQQKIRELEQELARIKAKS